MTSEPPRTAEPLPLDLLLHGAAGRMGREVAALVRDEPGLRLAAALDAPGHPAVGFPLADAAGRVALPAVDDAGALHSLLAHHRTAPAVIVDFSLPAALRKLLDLLLEHPVPLVSGTTGIGPEEEERLDRLAERVPVLWAPNMSLGVAATRAACRQLAAALGERFDIELVEVHHGAKRDAPSGTATALVRAMEEARAPAAAPTVLDRAVRGRPREAGGIGVSVVRGGSVVGDHTVHFLGPDERIELTHRAMSRRVFAAGAVRAARWIVGRPPGRWGMEQVLGLAPAG